MGVFLSARYSRAEELREYRSQLRAREVEVTSTWLEGPRDLSDAARPRIAQVCFDDIDRAQVVIAFAEESRTPSRGGRHVELGYALARGKRVLLVGPREHVFAHHPAVEHLEAFDVEEVLRLLNSEDA
jgi:nucleoside 2-deoxyribosyltransferase